MYHPIIISARPIRHSRFGSDEAVLLTDIVADGSVRFRHMMLVTHPAERQPFLYVTLEEGRLAQVGRSTPEGVSPHFLCLFIFEDARPRHANMGVATHLIGIDAFEARASALVAERVGQPAVALE